jgi:hypothetical protein
LGVIVVAANHPLAVAARVADAVVDTKVDMVVVAEAADVVAAATRARTST